MDDKNYNNRENSNRSFLQLYLHIFYCGRKVRGELII